jgi:hypothetical protein
MQHCPRALRGEPRPTPAAILPPILIVPGALAAGLGDALFWWSLMVGLLIAGAVAYPVNRWLLKRGKGHAVVHAHHAH